MRWQQKRLSSDPGLALSMELDIENFDALQNYLSLRGHLRPGEAVSFDVLPGGVSNRTVRATWSDGRSWVLKQALPKLRVNIDWFSSPERITVEAKALRWLNRIAPPGTTPAFVLEDATNHLMAMQAIPEDSENWKSILLRGEVVSEQFEQFGSLLGTIHRESSVSASEVSKAFADTTYFENLRLEPYYLFTAQSTPPAAGFLKTLARETLLHKVSLVHGDFSPKNTLLYQGKLILLDYEVVHWGDPAFDVGFALTHFLSKAHHLPQARARLAESAMLFWEVYSQEVATLDWASDLEPRAVRHALGCLLARVAGKSPLEYLTRPEQARQKEVSLLLMENSPTEVNELVSRFIEQIESHA
jgi:5-methylthioribose kinase